MKAILLAAGYGTRLRPLTNKTPKCLVPIKGKPLLEYWLDEVVRAGIKNIVVNTHYKAKVVEKFINKSPHSEYIEIYNEKNLLGTCGTLLKVIENNIDDDVLLLHSDNYSKQNLNDFIIAHNNRPKNCLLTMMTFNTDSPKTCGIVELKNNVVVGFHEKVEYSVGNIANGATYILSKEFLKIIKKDFSKASDFSTEILPHFVNMIFTFHTDEIFIDIGNIASYNLANNIKE